MRKPIYFVFGNHKHWSGMVWEWGEDTLVNSTNALARVIEETGLKAGLNFDGRGVEQLAIYDPASIGKLKRLLRDKKIEIWGGTYTQPYGPLIGHESNVAQRRMGMTSFMKILGARPKIFAEEEFDYFPQLPQMLKQLGYDGMLLFPQHTWHTPTFPIEKENVIWCEGIDGSRIRAVPFSHRCLMRGIPTAREKLAEIAEQEEPLMITWLEMLDKPNWMWRSDFVLKYIRDLQADQRYAIEPILLSEYLAKNEPKKARQYSLDDFFHGLSVGKNGDNLPRAWKDAETAIVRHEFLSAWASYLGHPYAYYSSFPEWRLSAAWQALCESQGHDAYECQGLTRSVGTSLAEFPLLVLGDSGKIQEHIAARTTDGFQKSCADGTTPFVLEGNLVRCPAMCDMPLGLPDGWRFDASCEGQATLLSEYGTGHLRSVGGNLASFSMHLSIEGLPPGILNSIVLPISTRKPIARIRVDTPFAVVDVHPNGEWPHKQPTGDWLTSEQVIEFIPKPIAYLSFVCIENEDGALLYASRQNMLALAKPRGIDAVLYNVDGWDGDEIIKRTELDFGFAYLKAPTNLQLLETAERICSSERFILDGRSFFKMDGPAFVTGVRKVAEELEMRFFETEGQPGVARVEFLWQVESVRGVNPLGEAWKVDFEIEGNAVVVNLAPREIITLRILFLGMRTEYPDIDKHRDIWVGAEKTT